MTAHPLVAVSVLVGVSDPRVLEGVGSVPRAAFVSPELAEQANLDRLLPIPHGQVTTQPSLVAWMVEALELEGSERVLEIGTGYGWQTALLGRLAARSGVSSAGTTSPKPLGRTSRVTARPTGTSRAGLRRACPRGVQPSMFARPSVLTATGTSSTTRAPAFPSIS